MNEMQEKLLGILKWFHAFCVEHGLTYYMAGGTMLGAVRHHGFIPWDDDLDVVVPRPDYEKIAAIAREEQSGRYRFEVYSEKKDYVCPYCKVYDTETTLVENTLFRTRRGLFLDVFPLDGLGNTMRQSRRAIRRVHFLRHFLSAYTYPSGPDRKGFVKFACALANALPHNTFRLQQKIERRCKKRAYEDCAYIGAPVGAQREKEIMPRERYGTPVLYRFEDAEFYGVAQPDAYLTQFYGDYMTPPPPEKRKTDHIYLEMDLHRSYLEPPADPPSD